MILESVEPCIYCGLPANSIDHIPPLVVRPILLQYGLDKRYRFVTVPACHNCNSVLGARQPWTVGARQTVIRRFLRRKYKRILAIPEWSDRNLAQLSPYLQGYVLQSLRLQELIQQRLQWKNASNRDEPPTPAIKSNKKSIHLDTQKEASEKIAKVPSINQQCLECRKLLLKMHFRKKSCDAACCARYNHHRYRLRRLHTT